MKFFISPAFAFLYNPFGSLSSQVSIVASIKTSYKQIKNYKLEKWKNGKMEKWKNGIMEYWNSGIME